MPYRGQTNDYASPKTQWPGDVHDGGRWGPSCAPPPPCPVTVPDGLWVTDGVDVALAPPESQWLVAPLLLELPLADGGDTEESEDELCWFMHWATAKPARQRGAAEPGSWRSSRVPASWRAGLCAPRVSRLRRLWSPFREKRCNVPLPRSNVPIWGGGSRQCGWPMGDARVQSVPLLLGPTCYSLD